MKTITAIMAAVTMALLLSQCKKDDATNSDFNAHFWTSVENNDSSALSLYINNVYKGELPYLASNPACGNADSITLSLTLPSGTYQLAAKDKQGITRTSSSFKIWKNNEETGMEVSSIPGYYGGCAVISEGNCVIVNLFY